jgi:hypothetical protein
MIASDVGLPVRGSFRVVDAGAAEVAAPLAAQVGARARHAVRAVLPPRAARRATPQHGAQRNRNATSAQVCETYAVQTQKNTT